MFVSGKLFAALIAAAVIGVTGSPVELEKRNRYSLLHSASHPSGPGENCANTTVDQNDCVPLEVNSTKLSYLSILAVVLYPLHVCLGFSPQLFLVPFWPRLSDSSSSRLRCSDYSCGADDGVTQSARTVDLVAVNFAQKASSIKCV
jgi:hypothetical protein